MNNAHLIHCQHIYKHYAMGKNQLEILHDINLEIQAGEYIAIVGPSGSGKSTLMNILGCLDTPSQGKYFLQGNEVSHLSKNELATVRNRKIGFIFQSFNLLAHATALENVALPLFYRGIKTTARNLQAKTVLAQMNLSHRLNHLPNELSGGERQRVAIARALITDPQLILADEPTGNLDSKTSAEMMEIFENLVDSGKTLLIVTHDLNIAKRVRRVITIKDGVIREP
jgi:putative ABC transport system ATP-binding protein